MEEIILSIIVPVYNGAEYIRSCLDSVLQCSDISMEVLVIDDGSTDDTPSICDSICQTDSRLRLIRQENRGVSAARNTGIQASFGKFLTFVDADDFLAGDILSLAIAKMDQHQYDLICWNHLCLRNGLKIFMPPLVLPEDPIPWVIYPNSEAGKHFRACWGKLFDGQLIRENQILFDETLYIGEDAVFLLEYLKHVKQLYVLPDQGYCYRIRQNSAVGRQQPELLNQSLLQKTYMDSYIHSYPTAVTGLYWDIFGKLLRNSLKNSDAVKWLASAREVLFQPGIFLQELPRLCRMQYRFGCRLPASMLCTLTRAALGLRRICSKGEPHHDKIRRRN